MLEFKANRLKQGFESSYQTCNAVRAWQQQQSRGQVPARPPQETGRSNALQRRSGLQQRESATTSWITTPTTTMGRGQTPMLYVSPNSSDSRWQFPPTSHMVMNLSSDPGSRAWGLPPSQPSQTPLRLSGSLSRQPQSHSQFAQP